MLKRIALVMWWLGVMFGLAMGFAAAVNVLKNVPDAHGVAIAILAAVAALPAIGAVFALPWWAMAFVLGGSFWKPPKP